MGVVIIVLMFAVYAHKISPRAPKSLGPALGYTQGPTLKQCVDADLYWALYQVPDTSKVCLIKWLVGLFLMFSDG